MEELRDSKLEKGQQWGKNTSSKDKVHWGRRPPFIEGKKSNRYVLSPHTSGTTAPRAVLPLHEQYYRSGGRNREQNQQNMNLGAVVLQETAVLPLG